jgi:DNA (cytosine-5)-methyltransferase 1
LFSVRELSNVLSVGSLFSGIGGFELGLERTGGFKTAWQCEIDPFCQKVLEKHWPDVLRFSDIKDMRGNIPYVDVICGGFPCQPVSCAGKRKGKEDERWLWPEFYRVVCEVKPRWVLVENVPGLLNADSGRLFAGILRDLAASGYDAEWNIVSAASVGAPHLRRRVFVVAHASCQRRQQDARGSFSYEVTNEGWPKKENNELKCNGQSRREGDVADSDQIRWPRRSRMFWQERRRELENGGAEIADPSGKRLSQPQQEREHGGSITECDWWTVEPDVGRVAHGIPSRVDRLRALGNAIVPQCAEYVGQCILNSLKLPPD